jgi:hypothetical protein
MVAVGTALNGPPYRDPADSDRQTVYVLLGRYADLAADLARRHPGASVREQRRDGELLYRAVTVPPLGDP